MPSQAVRSYATFFDFAIGHTMGRLETSCLDFPDLSRKSRDGCELISAACPDCPDLSQLIFNVPSGKTNQPRPVG